MRFSIISTIDKDKSEINRFFDHICKIEYFRKMPLFWLQWHMAMCAQKDAWRKAEEYLEMGYKAADAYEKTRREPYNRKQLDDRKAKLLAVRAHPLMRSGAELFRDMREALDIVGRLIRSPDLTYHPYETLSDIVKAIQIQGSTVPDDLNKLLIRQLKEVTDQAKSRLDLVPSGYQHSQASMWVMQIEATTAPWFSS